MSEQLSVAMPCFRVYLCTCLLVSVFTCVRVYLFPCFLVYVSTCFRVSLSTCLLVYLSTSSFPKYLRIRLRCFHQFIMRADGGDLAFAHDDDQVSPADLRQAMRDDEGRASACGVGDGALDLIFGSRVNCRG